MEKLKEEAKEFFSEQLTYEDDDEYSRWYVRYGKDGREESSDEATVCHAGLNPPELHGIVVFASNFDVHKGHEEVAERYWSFMTSEKSPWRCLFESAPVEKILAKNGRQSGFFVCPEDANDVNKKTLLYNFCIAMRMIHEEYDTIVGWTKLVDLGMDEVEALFLSRILTIRDDGTCLRTGDNDGSHWPLWFKSYDFWNMNEKNLYLDFDKLKNGKPNFSGRSCDQWTTKKVGALNPFTPVSPQKVIVKGKFSQRTGMLLDDIIPEFQEWLRNHQERMKA